MKKIGFIVCLLFLSPLAVADTLYQAGVGGYSTSVGVGLGGGINSGYTPYTSASGSYGGYYPGVSTSGVPYDSFSYPYSSGGCCGCNTCNNCDTSYSNRCR